MSRAGAKRKWKGSLGRQNVRPMSGDELAAVQPHRRGLPDALKLAKEADTELGRMYLMGELRDPRDPDIGWKRHEAGERYRTIVKAYLASIESPRDAPSLGKPYPCTGDPNCGLDESLPACECRARKIAYNAAFEALSEAGHRAQVEVAHVAVHDRKCGNIDYLVRGLDALVRHLLTNRRRTF